MLVWWFKESLVMQQISGEIIQRFFEESGTIRKMLGHIYTAYSVGYAFSIPVLKYGSERTRATGNERNVLFSRVDDQTKFCTSMYHQFGKYPTWCGYLIALYAGFTMYL
jgi:hypothetical protein